jgi:hypothetical protein
MPDGGQAVSRVELSPADLAAIQYGADTVPDLDARRALRGILKRADLAQRRGDLGDESLPGVGAVGDIAALLMPTPPVGFRSRTHR